MKIFKIKWAIYPELCLYTSIKCKILLIVFRVFFNFTVLSKISLLLIELDATHDSRFLTSVTDVSGREPKYPPYTRVWVCADGLG